MAEIAAARFGRVRKIKIDIVSQEQIEFSVAVVIEKGAARRPGDVVLPQTCFFGDIAERAVAVVMQQNVVSPEGNKQIHPAIIVVIAGANSLAPSLQCCACTLGYVGEGAVVLVAVKMAGGFLPGGKSIQPAAVR